MTEPCWLWQGAELQWKLFYFFCRNLYYFKCRCYQNVPRLISHNTYYIGCVFHCVEASKTCEAVLPQLLMSTKKISIINVGLRWNGHHWNCFYTFFHWQIRRSNSCHTNLRNSPICIHMYVMYGNAQFSDETCHLVYLELSLSFQILLQNPCSTCGAWQSLRSQTNDAPSVNAVPNYCPAV